MIIESLWIIWLSTNGCNANKVAVGKQPGLAINCVFVASTEDHSAMLYCAVSKADCGAAVSP